MKMTVKFIKTVALKDLKGKNLTFFSFLFLLFPLRTIMVWLSRQLFIEFYKMLQFQSTFLLPEMGLF